ncbi:beta-1,3-glucanase family protein [Streptomyces sp. MST-110588]|uniref:beta-1,3-glucanase family protein n=1 Tax=Streptomyces sp. MST-110588 TaxID=2833628 RepID=UPI001F5E12C3|nr:beta-1,3-glucanase family protein [Streptomyces sp. MST-110588]UNO42846.1 glycosyl hydrolase [Streptomyces sp. MST-110588]
MINRRRLLGCLAVPATSGRAVQAMSGLAIPAVAGAVAASATGRRPAALGSAAPAAPITLPLRIVNRTGHYANSSIRIYIVGHDGTRQVRVTPEGTLAPVALEDNGPDGFTDYALPLAASGTTTLRLPRMSGRLYVALGARLKFRAVRDGDGRPALAHPAGWVPSDPNYPVPYDCAEFTYDQYGMHCNTTMVDMFSVPMAIRLTGARDQTAGTLKDGARARIFAELAGTEGFSRLVVGDRRVIAPGHGLDGGLFARDHLAPYIDGAWAAYESRDLKVTTGAGTFTGRVRAGRLSFTGPSAVTAATAVSFAKPTTRDVLFCDGALAAPNDGVSGPVAAVLGAALNRSTLTAHAVQPTTDPALFYRERLTHHYARVMHAASVDGRAYGFAFDDVAGFAPYIEDGAPREMTLTLTPW